MGVGVLLLGGLPDTRPSTEGTGLITGLNYYGYIIILLFYFIFYYHYFILSFVIILLFNVLYYIILYYVIIVITLDTGCNPVALGLGEPAYCI